MNNRITILKNDLVLLRHSLKNFKQGKSYFKSKEQILDLIDKKEEQLKKLSLKPKED